MPPDETPPDPTIDVSRSSSSLPRRIGRYTIQGVIASGGMGTVYKAVQESPRRAVAVKVMRAGVSSSTELRRFEFEAQLLGRLRHPGIAQIYEAGTHDEGGVSVPFFAMEYIPNAKPITRYAEEKKLGTRERLELFARVCEAVHHGHQKGIIHRDLKPGNILVGPNGNPRIIDFGVARATDSDMALTLQQTDVGQLVGTVQYMSPEQCQADPHDIDTRSDVYSLGIVLYELLCGRLPYDVGSTPIFEATRVIRDELPTRPSQLDRTLRGDVETIVLKALEKDRDRRYQSAAELAGDLDRYLSGDAIAARPASAVYQLRIFARRNKGLLSAVTAVALVLIAGIVVSTALFFRGQTARARAAEQEATADGARNYLRDIMSFVNPVSSGENVSVPDLLDRFGENIEDRFADQPEVEAEVRFSLAQNYLLLNMVHGGSQAERYSAAADRHLDRALELQRKVFGDNDPRRLETIEGLAYFLGLGLNLARAEELRREALTIREASLGPDAETTVQARFDLAALLLKIGKIDEAEALTLQALDQAHVAAGGEDPAATSWLLARIRAAQGRLEEAEAILVHRLENARADTGANPKVVQNALDDLAGVYVCQGRLEEAAAIYDEAAPLDANRLGISEWFSDDGSVDDTAPALLVFWESWCPFSQAYVPRIDRLYGDLGQPAAQVIGMTSLNRNSTKGAARDFIERNDLSFPNAVYDGQAHRELGFDGYPAAAAVSDARVVWKGHPDKITAVFLDGLSGRPGSSTP